MSFNPNEPCADNGNFFGFPYLWENAPLVLIPVPWDVTTSYRAGAGDGPPAPGPPRPPRASVQLDFFDFEIKDAWKLGVGTLSFDRTAAIAERSRDMRSKAEKIIAFEEGGVSGSDYPAEQRKADRESIEQACRQTNDEVRTWAQKILAEGRKAAVVGGDHASPLGLMQALAQLHPDGFSILHFDAHDDLRRAYEGFTYSHASIMYNALQLKTDAGMPAVSKLVQVGVRDVCQDEQDFAAGQGSRIKQFPDIVLQHRLLEGEPWSRICADIIESLPEKVYISFDIDVFQPWLCPHTGTPVPGGLDFAQVRYLLSRLRSSEKQIIGFDLCEVAPNPRDPDDEWDGNVGARMLYMLSNTLLACI